MKIELALLAAQALSSYLSTLTMLALVGKSTPRYVRIGMISDAVKLTVISAVAATFVNGSWTGIAAAVLGGAIGNGWAHFRNREP